MSARVVLVAQPDDDVTGARQQLADAGADVRVVRLRWRRVPLPAGGGRVGALARATAHDVVAVVRPAPELLAAARDAEVVVALGRRSVAPVWRLRRRTRAALVNGVPAAVHLLTSAAPGR